MGQHFGRLPLLEFAVLDLVRHLVQDGIGDGFVTGRHADLSQLNFSLKAGTAGALRASSNSLSALFINPANLAATRVYHLGAFAQIWPEASRQSYGAAAVDSVVSSTRIAGGVGATYNIQDTDGIDRKWTDVRFALAYPIADEFFLGLGGRYTWLYQNGLGPLGTSLASSGLPGARIVRGFSVDAGATLRPNEHFSASIVGIMSAI